MQYGFVFGIMPLAAFFAAPVFGRYGDVFGAKNTYNFGALVQAIITISLGSLVYIENMYAFLAISYTLRSVKSVIIFSNVFLWRITTGQGLNHCVDCYDMPKQSMNRSYHFYISDLLMALPWLLLIVQLCHC